MLNVQIADDNNEREQGLMLRESLAEDEGMLFVFDDLNYRSFWMKNTLIPLDMIFIGKDLKIVGIKSAYPCKADPCEIYNSGKPAMYVLETNAGFAEMNGIDEGDKIIANNKYLNKPSAQNG